MSLHAIYTTKHATSRLVRIFTDIYVHEENLTEAKVIDFLVGKIFNNFFIAKKLVILPSLRLSRSNGVALE
jgi:hypothetical protein